MLRRLIVLALFLPLLLLFAGDAAAGGKKVALVDSGGLTQGTAAVKLAKGSVSAKATLLPLPAMIDTGDGVFEAHFYRAYLISSIDEAIEISLGGAYPKASGKTKVKAALKGDLSLLGLDRLVIVAFSKDGLSSFDVLTGTLDTQ